MLVQQNKMPWLEMCGDFKEVFPYFKPSLNTSVYFGAFARGKLLWHIVADYSVQAMKSEARCKILLHLQLSSKESS